jgi:hypothetical protein
MNWCDERLGLPAEDGPDHFHSEEHQAAIAAMPVEDLVRGWRAMNRARYPDKTAGCWCFDRYFDALGHQDPQRAVDFIAAELAGEPDDAMVALIADGKLLPQLLHFNAPKVAGRLVETALRVPRLRWLLGGVYWSIRGGMVESERAKQRLLAIADRAAYDAWKEALQADAEEIDFDALALPELARVWIEMTARSPREKLMDDNAARLFDWQGDLVRDDPDRALALIREVLRQEPHPAILGVLAAGLLEDLIPAQEGPVFDAIEAEAQANPRFRHLLGGVWFSSMSPAVVARLEKVTDRSRW